MNTLTFQVIGEPKGQPRPRAFARKMGAIHVARFYDSDVADTWKRLVTVAIIEAAIRQKWAFTESPVAVDLRFAMPRPKAHFSAKGLLRETAPKFHTSRTDCDNLAKLVLDRLTQSGRIWRDDSQVIALKVDKFWAVGNEHGCTATITTVEI
jgi:Holliday junction resolvase RusA-like endonuclease